MVEKYCEIDAFYTRMGREMDGVLYTPRTGMKDTAVVVIHSDADYLNFTAGPNLARRRFLTLCANVERPNDLLEKRLPNVAMAIEMLRARPGISRVVLFGHSGGAILMSCYQAVAENGAAVFQDDHKIVKMGEVGPLPAADAVMLIDSNFGNGVMTLVSLDPAITDETHGTKQDPAYDAFACETGYSKDGGVCYTEEFKAKYYAAQAKRQERLISYALDRLSALEQNAARYEDNEPLIVPGGSQIAPNNRLFPQDLHPHASNQTTVRVNWCPKHAMEIPRFVHEEHTVVISLANPYHLQDVPRARVFINTYTATRAAIEAVVERLCGEAPFQGESPVDPFCGLFDTRL